MNIKFIAEQQGPFKVVVNGREIGEVLKNQNQNKYLASLKVTSQGVASLAQGWGDTPHDAVMNAFPRARAEVADYLKKLEALEAEILEGPTT